jgi:hypothetical protein
MNPELVPEIDPPALIEAMSDGIVYVTSNISIKK